MECVCNNGMCLWELEQAHPFKSPKAKLVTPDQTVHRKQIMDLLAKDDKYIM